MNKTIILTKAKDVTKKCHNITVPCFLNALPTSEDVTPTSEDVTVIKCHNITMLGYKIPKDRVKGFKEIERPGVYFLFGEREKDEQLKVYIGQSENVHDRFVNNHLNSEKKDWWRWAVVFVGMEEYRLSLDCTLYLERKLVNLAEACGRYKVETEKTREIDPPDPSRDSSWNDFFEWIKIFIKALECDVLDPESRNSKLFYIEVEGGKATGQRGCSSGRFYVHKGSHIARRLQPRAFKERSLREKVKDIRKDLPKEKGTNPKTFVVQEEFYCSSPRMAARVVTGRCRKRWKSMEDQSCSNLKKRVKEHE